MGGSKWTGGKSLDRKDIREAEMNKIETREESHKRLDEYLNAVADELRSQHGNGRAIQKQIRHVRDYLNDCEAEMESLKDTFSALVNEVTELESQMQSGWDKDE